MYLDLIDEHDVFWQGYPVRSVINVITNNNESVVSMIVQRDIARHFENAVIGRVFQGDVLPN